MRMEVVAVDRRSELMGQADTNRGRRKVPKGAMADWGVTVESRRDGVNRGETFVR